MPTPVFPEIGCGAVAQYPASFEVAHAVRVQRSVDGTEQRFLRSGQSWRRWLIRLQRLTEEDAGKLREFFASVQGRATAFRFRDPWTMQWHEPCWFESDILSLDQLGDDQLQGELTIATKEG